MVAKHVTTQLMLPTMAVILTVSQNLGILALEQVLEFVLIFVAMDLEL